LRWYVRLLGCSFFFFSTTSTTQTYTLSLHDALPISADQRADGGVSHQARSAMSTTLEPPKAKELDITARGGATRSARSRTWRTRDRKSTRLNSSHVKISYAVFCLKKKKKTKKKKNQK